MEDLQIDGALLHIVHSTHPRREIYVGDILTQRWKELSPPPKSCNVCSKVVSNKSLGTCKAILFSSENYLSHDSFRHGHDCFAAHVFDSNSETWSTVKFAVTRNFFWAAASVESRSAGAAYINGVLYMVTQANPQHLLAFNLAERTLEELELSFNDEDTHWVRGWVDFASLLVCNDNRLLIVTFRCGFERMHVLEVDLHRQIIDSSQEYGIHSLQLRRLSSGPPAPFSVWRISPKIVTDGNCSFFTTRGPGKEMLAYNVDEDAWSSFPIPAPVAPFDYKTYHLICGSFQPSFTAFMPL